MGRRRDENYTLQKNNSIQDSMGTKKNVQPFRDPYKTMINITKEPNDTH
jgi:hypothetical protein